jgi:OmpA-like transmembrane domain
MTAQFDAREYHGYYPPTLRSSEHAAEILIKRRSPLWAHFRCSLSILFVVLVGLAPEVAGAADLLGLYIGGAAGQSQLRGEIKSFNCGPFVGSPGASCLGGISAATPSVSFGHNTTGWEAFAGIRPVSFLGAEVEYIDFGSSGGTSVAIDSTANTLAMAGSATTHPTATALFAVGYLPVPVPHLDIFAKAGVAVKQCRAWLVILSWCPIWLLSACSNGQSGFDPATLQPPTLDGSAPSAGLIQGRDGNFYGVTANGGRAPLATGS